MELFLNILLTMNQVEVVELSIRDTPFFPRFPILWLSAYAFMPDIMSTDVTVFVTWGCGKHRWS